MGRETLGETNVTQHIHYNNNIILQVAFGIRSVSCTRNTYLVYLLVWQKPRGFVSADIFLACYAIRGVIIVPRPFVGLYYIGIDMDG